MGKFIINEDTDFTPSSLKKFLNKKHGGKKNGKPFNNQDIQQYTLRGKLPDEYSGKDIEVISNEEYGLKILRIKNLKNGS